MKRTIVAVICVLLSVSVAGPTSAEDGAKTKPMKVFVFGGQSNMAGAGNPADLPETMRTPSNNVLCPDDPLQPTGWVPYEPGQKMGPEIAFCHEMSKALGEPVGFVKFAIGGTNLGEQWNPDGGPLYATFRDRVQAARKLGNVEVVAFLWMQGEKDSRTDWMAEKYAENLKKLVTRARADFQSPEMIFVCGRVNPHFTADTAAGQAPETYPFVFQVRKAQEGLDLPRTAWVDCDDLTRHGDNLHYNSPGQIELGKRLAGEVLEILNKPK